MTNDSTKVYLSLVLQQILLDENLKFLRVNPKEIINAPVEIITVSSSEDELEDADACTPGLAASKVSESSGDEGGEDLDGAAESTF